MKILLVNKYFYVRGGSETYFFGLADLLKKRGHEVLFFAMQDERNLPCAQEQYFVSNVEFNGDLSVGQKLRAAGRMIYSFEAKKKFEELILAEKPDIVHINLFHRVLTASIVDAAKKHGIPVVFTMHDLNCICPNHTMLDHGGVCEACLHGRYLNCVKRVCFKDSRSKCLMAAIESEFNKLSGLYNKIDLFITPSEFYADLLRRSGLTKRRVVHMKNFLPEDADYRASGGNDGYFLYFGRLSWEKGVMTLLKAVEAVPGVRLRIAGAGPEAEGLEAYVAEHQMSDRVTFLGFLTGETLKDTVNRAKCIVLPSEWYENGPYSVMEAMAAGKPVIASDIGGLPEIVDDGVTGFISEACSAESISECIKKLNALSDMDYEEMSRNAVAFAREQFLYDRYYERLHGYYSELMKKP